MTLKDILADEKKILGASVGPRKERRGIINSDITRTGCDIIILQWCEGRGEQWCLMQVASKPASLVRVHCTENTHFVIGQIAFKYHVSESLHQGCCSCSCSQMPLDAHFAG